jgi:hypothetical protein
MLVSAENKLHLIDQVKAIDSRVHAFRYDRGARGARQAAERECDDKRDFRTTHNMLSLMTGARFELTKDAWKRRPCRPTPRLAARSAQRHQGAVVTACAACIALVNACAVFTTTGIDMPFHRNVPRNDIRCRSHVWTPPLASGLHGMFTLISFDFVTFFAAL